MHKGIEAVTSIELTLGKDGKPNNTVHFTLLTDDPRSEPELRLLIETACERQGLVNKIDFCITYQDHPDGYGRFNYFTKYGEKFFDKVILFRPKLLKSGKSGRTLQKFYQIGNWFDKPKKQIWDDIKAYLASKDGTDPDKSECANATEQEAINDVAPSIEDEIHDFDGVLPQSQRSRTQVQRKRQRLGVRFPQVKNN